MASLRLLVEQLTDLQVDNAREQGWSWQQIADALASAARPSTRSTPVAVSEPGGPDVRALHELARQAVVRAQEEARALRHPEIGAEHLLLGLLRRDTRLASALLRKAGRRPRHRGGRAPRPGGVGLTDQGSRVSAPTC